MYTASFAFFEALWDAGVTHCFVNLGSDHPSIMEAIVKGQKEKPDKFPRIITCPHETVAMAMADGYARVTNRPQCVIVHVDVGTQNLGAIVHDSSAGRAPVLIFAGLSPCTFEGEYTGSRGEYIHWLQDVRDQTQIVAQYCRYVGEIRRGRNVKQLVNRALSFATSDPKGPVYLVGTREAMEEEIQPYQLDQSKWTPAMLGALASEQVSMIAEMLVEAQEPLVLTGYSGRNHDTVASLVALANTVKGLRVLDVAGSDMCFPSTHPAWLGCRMGVHEAITTADTILVIDSDVPWIPTLCRPRADAKIVHIDADPLKQSISVFYIDAIARIRADCGTAIKQITQHVKSELQHRMDVDTLQSVRARMEQQHHKLLASIEEQAKPTEDACVSSAFLAAELRRQCPADTIWTVEAVTNATIVSDQIQASLPGSWINCGGGGLGWSGGGALGIKLATDAQAGGRNKGKFVCQIVADGSFMFSVPSSVSWIAQRYGIAVLTVILNNNGWNAPRKSLLLVHPHGLGSKVDNGELNISFAPTPNYAGIAKAAADGKIWTSQAQTVEEVKQMLPKAIESVRGGIGAVLEVKIHGVSEAGIAM